MTTPAPRHVNDDDIAHLYDAQPYRDKTPDPALLAWHQDHPVRAILDMCCGTGNQLIANRERLPGAVMVGLDASKGMLMQARAKSPGIAWVHADSTASPFADNSFDYISHQFAFHHIAGKRAADRLDNESKSKDANLVRALLEIGTHPYLDAAEHAKIHLSSVWFQFLR